ncbi:MAG: hypothetical protein ACLFQA_04960 [Bacteroidales bacterium]
MVLQNLKQDIINMKIVVPLLFILLVYSSCTNFESNQKEALARVHSNYLYRSDISGIFPDNISEADSIKIARNYIDKWIRKQLFLRLAEINLPEEEKDVEKQIADFRASLLIHKYQQFLLMQKLDSTISQNEIREYYKDHLDNFILDKPAIKGIFLKVPLDSPNRDMILPWFRNGNDVVQLENYARQYADSYAWFDEDWLYLDDILKNIPENLLNNTSGLSNTDHLVVTGEEYQFFIGITDYLEPRNEMPFSLASQKIKSIILNKRKIKFLNELEQNILTEGSSKNSYQYF